jgi:hypothetical protein
MKEKEKERKDKELGSDINVYIYIGLTFCYSILQAPGQLSREEQP